MHKFLFYNKFIKCLYMFRAVCAHHQEDKLYYTASGIITLCRWPLGAQDGHLQSVMIPDAVLYNFDLLMMSTTVLETCRGI